MYIKLINNSNDIYKEYLIQFRKKAVEEHGFQANENSMELLPFATYFGLFVESLMVGFLEAYLYDEAFGGYKNNFFSNHFDLNKICPSPQMCHVRTIFVESNFRRKSSYFFCLCFNATQYFYEQKGIKFATLSTLANDNYLNKLYFKMGAKMLFSLDITFGPKTKKVNFFVVELEHILRKNRIARRVKSSFSSDRYYC